MRIFHTAICACFTGLTLVSFSLFAQETKPDIKPLQAGERIVFLGDSITQGGVSPDGYVTLVKNAIAEKYADLKIEVIGAGISGNKVPNLQQRLEKDVLAKKPTIVFIYIGINDVWHSVRNNGTSKENYEAGLHDLVKRISESQARVILCTPSVIGEKAQGTNELDAMLDEYSEISRKVATATKSQMLDLRSLFVTHLKQHNSQNAEKGILTSDRVHLNKAGNRFVADQILSALGVNMSTPRLLRHLVFFKFKSSATEADVQKVVEAFGELPGKIPQIAGYEQGINVSPEGLADGFSHGFMVTFKTTADRDAYLPHPAHKEFVSVLKPHLEKAYVFDFWGEK